MDADTRRCCETCGAVLIRHRKHSRAQWASKRFCERKCAGALRLKWRECACGCGGRPLVGCKYVKGHLRPKLSPAGYRRIWLPGHPLAGRDGLVQEHRLIVYEAGVEIPPGHHVHHINGVKDDNRLENLEVIECAEHTRRHVRAAGVVTNQYGTFPVWRSLEASA